MELFLIKFPKISKEINHLQERQESYEISAESINNYPHTDLTSPEPFVLLRELIAKKPEKPTSTYSTLYLSCEKNFLQNSLQDSKNKLTQCIEYFKETKTGAANQIEIEYLLSIAKQRVAAVNLSIATDNLNQAQRSWNTEKYITDATFNSSNNFSTGQPPQQAKPKEENTSARPQIKFLETVFEQKALYLNGKKAEVEDLEKVLQTSTLAVEKAKLALDECIFTAALSNPIDDAIMTTPASPQMTDDSLAIDETQLYAPVIATGVEEHLDAYLA